MKVAIVTGIVAGLFFAAPTLAQQVQTKPGYYVQLTGGSGLVGQSKVDASVSGPGGSGSGSIDVGMEPGIFASASFGNSMPSGWAIEVEGLYVKNDYDDGDLEDLFGGPVKADVEGKAVMLNAIYAIAPIGPAVLHAGGGVGYGRTTISSEGASVESDGMMWQAMAGFTFHASPTLSYDLTYRYLQLSQDDLSFDAFGYSGNVSSGTAVNAVTLGARLKF
ncbi:MAG: porin family protein [Caulobacterales bacterium]|nr:porin family protein [Caulobacterales bacterium]